MDLVMFEQILYYHWIVLGLILVVLEMMMPGFVLLWFGVAAVLVGGLLYIAPEISWQWQVFIFSMLSILSIVAWRHWSKNNEHDDPDSGALNQRGKALIGRESPLIEPIVNGFGRIQLDDTFWRVSGESMEAGVIIKIVGVDGATLQIQKVI